MAEDEKSTVETATGNLTDSAQPKHASPSTTGDTVMDWCRATGIRAVKTGAQTLIAMIGTGMVGILDVDWANCLSVTLVAMLLSVLTSVAGLPEVNDGASVTRLGKD